MHMSLISVLTVPVYLYITELIQPAMYADFLIYLALIKICIFINPSHPRHSTDHS